MGEHQTWSVSREIYAERRRQVVAEGYTEAHDNLHDMGDLAMAAACYAMMAGFSAANRDSYPAGKPMIQWPWDPTHWKPGNRRRELIKAGALILAEIERLDRRAGRD